MRSRLPVVVIFALVLAANAAAATIFLNATAQGWMTAGGSNGFYAANDYVVGNCGAGDCYTGEFRNFFQFAIPTLDAPVLSAALLLDTRYEALGQSSFLTYQVTSAGQEFGFADLGTGTVYGSRTYSAADQYKVERIDLDGAGLAALEQAAGGLFTLGGRVTSSAWFGPAYPDELVFGHSNAPQALEIVTGRSLTLAPLSGSTAAPEPASAALFLSGVLLVFIGRLRR